METSRTVARRVLAWWSAQATRWGSRRLVAAVALVMALPSLGTGLSADDYWHRQYFRHDLRYVTVPRSPFTMFAFLDGDEARNAQLRAQGVIGWWSDSDVRIVFFRPLTSLTHALDYWLWPSSPLAMHAVSAAWYVALALAANRLLRLVFRGSPELAAVAALAYVLDVVHGMPLGWLAGRNGLIATTFALAAVGEHVRARAAGSRVAAVASPALLALALLSGESGLGAVGFVFAYELCLDRAPPARRALSMAPHALVVAAWAVVYRLGHHGGRGSGVYLGEGSTLGQLARNTAEYLPINLAAELGAPFSDLLIFVTRAAVVPAWFLAVAVVALTAWVARAVLRTSPEVRFFALAGVLATLPTCATFPNGRLTILSGLGLVVVCVAAAARAVGFPGDATAPATSPLERAHAGYQVVARLVLGPALLALSTLQIPALQARLDQLEDSLGAAPDLPGQRLMLVTAPNPWVGTFFMLSRYERGSTAPASLLVMGPSTRRVAIERLDEQTLLVRPDQGFLVAPIDELMHDPARRFAVGTRVDLGDVVVEVTGVDARGNPTEARFRFAAPLESPRWRWLTWEGHHVADWELPAVGQRVTLPGRWLFE